MKRLENKVAVITGSSRGLGLAIAQAYAAEGAVVVLAARSHEMVEKAAQDLMNQGARALAAACDVTDLAQVQALADAAIQSFGRIDIWVNNAGIAGVFGPTAHVPVDRFESVLRTNIFGTYYGSQVALQHFLPRNQGKLINLLGRGDKKPVPFQSAYGSSKTWVRSFTLAAASEYKHTRVGVYAFNPGLVDTELLRQIDAVEGYESRLKPLSTIIRLWANPPEVPAQKAVWIASAATDGKTGLCVNVLGPGETIGGLIRDMSRKIRRSPVPDTSLDIRSIESQLEVPGVNL